MTDVCLVSMPYASLQRPSMALGLLKGILDRDGLDVTTLHANLWFAEKVGVDLYEGCSSRAPAELLIGEWTFAEAAFPQDRARDERYLDQLRRAGRVLRVTDGDGDALVRDLRTLRKAAGEFVDEVARRVLATGARIVGCTSTFEQHVASLALLRRVRELAPDVVTMMGGANCETEMGKATHDCFPWVDYVVSGEADGLIAGLCRNALVHGRGIPAGDLPRGVIGPVHRAGRDTPGRPKSPAPARALFRDLDSLPLPLFDDYFDTLAKSELADCITPGLPLETSRGCWWGDVHQCTFCGLNGSSMAYRSKSPERTLEEIRSLEDTHGISGFEVVDNILDMGYFRTVLPSLARDPRPRTLFYEVKANLSRRQVETLRAGGVTWVQPGIESLHSDVLRLMDKGVSGWQNVQLLKWARELGLRMSWSVLWGFPGEKDAAYTEMARWMPLLEHLQAPGGMTRLRYDRFSVYHQQADKLGLLLMPVPAMSYVYPVGPADLNRLAYFFTNDPGTDRFDLGLEARIDLSQRPGAAAVREAVHNWQDAFRSSIRPMLSVSDTGTELRIMDTRRCAVRRRTRLTGVARAVMLACDAAPRPGRLAGILQRDFGMDAAQDEIDAAVRQLTEDFLVLPIDGRLLGLAVPGSLPALPHSRGFPGGFVDIARAPAVSGATMVADGQAS